MRRRIDTLPMLWQSQFLAGPQDRCLAETIDRQQGRQGHVISPRDGPGRVAAAYDMHLGVGVHWRVGDTLEGGYKLMAISAQELVFNHVQNNVTLKLAVAGGNS